MPAIKSKASRVNGAAATIFEDITKHCGVVQNEEVRQACRTLTLKAGQLHTLCEDECNGGTSGQKQRFDRKEITWEDIEADLQARRKLLQQEIHSAVLVLTRNLKDRGKKKDAVIKIKFEGDPRGFTTKLDFPNGYSNSWGGGYGLMHNRSGD
jgi:hypothetical protein